MSDFTRNTYIKEAKVIPVIRITTLIGRGTEEDPTRDGFEYRDIEGNLLFITDAEVEHKMTYEPAKNLPFQR